MSAPLPARVFGPGHAHGSAALLFWDFGTLRLELADGTVLRAGPDAVTVRASGFGGDAIEFTWQENGQRWACHVAAEHASTCRAQAPAAVARVLDAAVSGIHRQRRRRRLAWSLLVGGALVLLASLVGSHNRIVDAVAALISPRFESQLGSILFARLERTLTLTAHGPQVDAVRRFGALIAPDAPFTYRFHVADDAAINAFALPGGIIVVNRGLIEATSRPEELAGVLAHEVAHVELRHSLKGVLRASAISVLTMAIAGDPDLGGAGTVARKLLTLVYSRADERAADADGHARLVARGIDPGGLATFFAAQATRTAGGPPAWLSTHPGEAERAAALAALDRRTTANCCGALAHEGAWPPRN